jgi:hypothetical protein
MDISKKDGTQVAQDCASRSDVEDMAVETVHEVKRDLGRRHINMIAIAGMIVSLSRQYQIVRRETYISTSRALDCFLHLARR